MVRSTVFTLLLCTATASATVPPPPPLPSVLKSYKRAIATPTREQIDRYLTLFSPSVRIIENDKEVGTSRSQWKSYLIANLAWSIKRRLVSYGNPTLVADSVFFPSDGCCLHTRFAVFHFGGDGLVDQVRFTTGGTFWDGSSQP